MMKINALGPYGEPINTRVLLGEVDINWFFKLFMKSLGKKNNRWIEKEHSDLFLHEQSRYLQLCELQVLWNLLPIWWNFGRKLLSNYLCKKSIVLERPFGLILIRSTIESIPIKTTQRIAERRKKFTRNFY